MPSGRVVITGQGWVTPLGFDVASVWSKLMASACAIGPVRRWDASTFATNFAAETPPLDLFDFLDRAAARHPGAGLGTRFALAAAAQAWVQAGLGSHDGAERHPGVDPSRVGLYLGSGEGQVDTHNMAAANIAAYDAAARKVDTRRWAEVGLERMNVVRELEQEPHAVLTHLADAFACRGPAFNCMTACAASTQSVGEATHLIRRGDADVMLAGGSHTMIHPLGMTGFIRLTAMSTRRDDPKTASRPFSRTRDGFVMGEGAGMLVLEDRDHALARGAAPLAEIVGYGASADAFRITDIQPDGKGAQAAMRMALRHAGIDPRETDALGRPPVHYISAHGTGTQENDAIETRAVKGVFAEQAPRIPFSSVKSMMGHLIQAAGAVELITCVQAIRTGWVPPTINLHDPDPACDLDYVPNQARDMTDFWGRGAGGVDVAMSNGFGFGGQNNTVVVRRYTP